MKNKVFLVVDEKGATLICDAISKNITELQQNIKDIVFMARKEQNTLNIITSALNHLSCEVIEKKQGVYDIYCRTGGKLNISIEGLPGENMVFEIKKDGFNFAEYNDFVKVLKKYTKAKVKQIKEV